MTSAEAFHAQQAVFQTQQEHQEAIRRNRPDVRMNRPVVAEIKESAWTHLSLYHTLGRVQRWVFGFADWKDVWVSVVILIGVTVASLTILFHRISAPMRV